MLRSSGPAAVLAELELAYRARGVDIAECDGKRELAVKTLDEEHRLEDEQARQRAERNRPFWKKLTPWREQ